MSFLSGKNITALVTEKSSSADDFVSAIEFVLTDATPASVSWARLSQISTTDVGDAVVSMDSVQNGWDIEIDHQKVVDVIRKKAGNVAVVLYAISKWENKTLVQAISGKENAFVVYNANYISEGLRLALGLPQ